MTENFKKYVEKNSTDPVFSYVDFNYIYLGDCYYFIQHLRNKSVDLLVTDPPYEFKQQLKASGIDAGAIIDGEVSGSYNPIRDKMHSHMSRIHSGFGMSFSPIPFLNSCKRIMKKFNGYFFSSRLSLAEYIGFATDNKFLYDILIWSKPNPIPNYKGHYLSDIEYIVFIHERGSFFDSSLDYSMYFKNFNYPKGKKESSHPTEKPLQLVDKFILVSSKPGDVVFDPFLGSGTTAVSAVNNGRKYLGCENNKLYYDMSISRLKARIEESSNLFGGL